MKIAYMSGAVDTNDDHLLDEAAQSLLVEKLHTNRRECSDEHAVRRFLFVFFFPRVDLWGWNRCRHRHSSTTST